MNFLGVLVLLFYLSGCCYSDQQEYSTSTKELRWIQARDSLEHSLVKTKLKKDVNLFSEGKDNLVLKRVICSNYSLLLVIPEHACGYCVDSEIRSIKEYSRRLKDKSFYILTRHRYKKEIRNFKYFNKLDGFKVFSVKDNTILMESINGMVKPIFLIVDRNCDIIDVFIPAQEVEDLSRQFLDICLRKYLNS
ncbi:hypothetical protein EYV94_16460 [Puteibacter caeruleilacunae]|nr:hypothetical protein EYV94_16460 [Puteibacter caeruleilacunae]